MDLKKPLRQLMVLLGISVLVSIPIHGHALPFNDDMVDVQLNAGEISRPRVEGTVPVGMLDDALLTRESVQSLTNPLNVTDDVLTRGKVLFQINCSACHGNIGEEDYVPGVAGSKMGSPDLSHKMYRERTDGHIFSYIHFGGAIMPRLGWKLSTRETWEIISYVRDVQHNKKEQ